MKDMAADDAFTNADRAARSDAERALVAREWSEHHAIRLQNPRAAIERELVLLESMTESAARTLLEADIGRWRLMIGEAPLPEPSSLAALDDDPMTALNAATYEVMYAAQAGRFSQARAALARARPLADRARLTVPSAGGVLDLFEFRVLLYENGVAAAEPYARERQRDEFNDAVGIWSYALASLTMHSGRVVEAVEMAEYAVEQLLWRDFSGLLGTAVALRAAAAAQLGSPTWAHELLATPSTGDVKEMLQRIEVQAWLLVAAGDRVAAAAALRAAGERAMEMHANALAAPSLYLAVRLGEAESVIELLRTIAATAEGVFIHAMVRHGEGAVARNAEALLAAAVELADIGFFAGAVDAASQAAALFRSAGRGERERRASILVAKWGVGLSGFRTARDRRGSLDLTEREWSIARAAADRQRSKEIAEQLGLSVRTVDNHLTNIYRKLGVAGCDELRAEIERLD
jgi:DNA-binding CsgD family transcriptional regulator